MNKQSPKSEEASYSFAGYPYPKMFRDCVNGIQKNQNANLPISHSFQFEKMFFWNGKQGNQFFHDFASEFNDYSEKGKLILDSFHARRREQVAALRGQGYEVSELICTLIEPFVSGLGMGHVTETGFRLDRNMGVPFYPASSLKGALRQFSVELSPEDDRTRKLLFGTSEEGQGKLLLFDVFPIEWPRLKVDIMTPHYPEYYSNLKDAPSDDQSPVPVPFLTVAQGSSFHFCVAIYKEDEKSSELLERAIQYLEDGMQILGLGGKTAVGYGRFKLETRRKS